MLSMQAHPAVEPLELTVPATGHVVVSATVSIIVAVSFTVAG